MTESPSGRVTLRSAAPPLVVTAWLAGPATVAAGYASWEVLDRPRRVGLPVFQGHAPYAMTLPLLLDGFIAQTTVEAEIARLERMARLVPGAGRPPVVRAAGPLPRGAMTDWVVSALEWGDGVIRSPEDGRRLRQDVTVTLIQFVEADVVVERSPALRARARAAASRTGRPAPDPVRVVRQGERSLTQIAARELGAASRWREIARLNGIRDPKAIRPGQPLRMPA